MVGAYRFNNFIISHLSATAQSGKTSVVVHLRDVRFPSLGVTDEPLGVVVGHAPEEIFVHVTEAVTLAREDQHVEPLVGSNQSVDHADGVGRVDVVVDVPVYKHQVAFQIGCNLRIGLDAVDERGVTLVYLLQDSVMLLAPPTVVDAVVVVSGAGDCYLEEVRIFQNRGSAHESATGMPVDTHPVKVYE